MKKRMLWVLAACLLLVLAAGCAPARGEQVFTSGDYRYTLDKDDAATILAMPAADPEDMWLVPRTVDGHSVKYVDVSDLPENIHQILTPPRCSLKSTGKLDHEVFEFLYLDYEYVQDAHYDTPPHILMGPDDLILSGHPYRYAAGGKREDLVQDYYLYPTSANGKKIWFYLYHDYVTLYTSGLYTYYKLSPETIAICEYSDRDPKKVTVPESVDGLAVVSINALPDMATVLFATYATEIQLPSTLKVLGRSAIYSSKLKKLVLPDGLEEIGDHSIEVWSLKNVALPSSLRRIGVRFMHIKTGKLVIPDGVTEIAPHAFDDLFLKTLELPDSLAEIPAEMCTKQGSLQSITIPAGVTSIGRSAFRDCSGLKTVKAKGNVLKRIGDFAFADCKALSKFEFPEGLEEIGNQSFYGCKKLDKLTMPSTLRKIGYCAFGECTGLKKITLGAGVEEIDPDAFAFGAKKLTIIAPEGSYAAEFAVQNGFNYQPAK